MVIKNIRYRIEIAKIIASIILASLAIWVFRIFGIDGTITVTILTALGTYLLIKIVDIIQIAVRKRVLEENIVKSAKPLFDLTKGIFIFLAIIALLNYYGVNVTSILLGWGFILFVIAVSIQGIISDLFSGIFLVISRKLKTGDIIVLNGEVYEVIEISLQSTFLKNVRTRQISVVSNFDLLKSRIDVISIYEDRFSIKVPVKSFNKVKEKLKELGISFNILKLEKDVVELELINEVWDFDEKVFKERSKIIEEIIKLIESETKEE